MRSIVALFLILSFLGACASSNAQKEFCVGSGFEQQTGECRDDADSPVALDVDGDPHFQQIILLVNENRVLRGQMGRVLSKVVSPLVNESPDFEDLYDCHADKLGGDMTKWDIECLVRVATLIVDRDADDMVNDGDNCPTTPNPRQEDRDNDGLGDACDKNPSVKDPPGTVPAHYLDVDNDGFGEACDSHPNTSGTAPTAKGLPCPVLDPSRR